MPRKGENIYKRKDGRWEGRYIKSRSLEGKAIYGYLYAPSYRELKSKMAHAVKYENPKKEFPPEIGEMSDSIVFQMAADSWLNSVRPQVKESTLMKYTNLLEDYILPALGRHFVSGILYRDIEECCGRLLREGGAKGTGLSSKTVSDCLSLIRRILRYAADQGYRTSYDGKSIVIKQRSKEMRVLSHSEQKLLCDYLYDHLNERNAGILVCLFTGMRIGEICALKWKDISLSEKIIYVHRTMQRIQIKEGQDKKTKITISSPKSQCSSRAIPLPDELAELLKGYKRAENAFVLTGMEYKYVEPRTMQNHFYKIIEKCSIKDANFHSLRHTFATRCVELGFDIKSLSEILGHASVNITMNRYVHPTMDLKRENMMRLSQLLTVRE